MDMATYWPRVFWRALTDTVKFFGGPRILLPPLIFTVGTFIHVYRVGAAAALKELGVAASYGLGAFLLVFAALFAVNFLWTPPKFESEATKESRRVELQLNAKVDELEKHIFDREARQKQVNALWVLRSDGVNIRNAMFQNEADYYKSGWVDRYEQWLGRVLEQALEISPNLHAWLSPLDRTVDNPPNIRIVCGDHELKARVASTVLHRLQLYLQGELDIERRK